MWVDTANTRSVRKGMYFDNTYEVVDAVSSEGTGGSDTKRRESLMIQNNDYHGVPPSVPPSVPPESKEERKSKRLGLNVKHFIVISALAAILCILSALLIAVGLFSVQLNKLKLQLSELEASRLESSVLEKPTENSTYGTVLNDIELLSAALKGHHPLYPASSCASTPSILNSGYYWIQSWNGSVVKVYCDVTRRCGNITGGWMRVALLDMRDNSAQCPPGLCLNTTPPRTCRKCAYNVTCSSDVFPVYINYTKVCGKIIGYQIGTVDAFSKQYTGGLDGVKLSRRNPSENIWTFAAAFAETYLTVQKDSLCPCINRSDSMIPASPTEIGSNYFCDTGARNHPDVFKFKCDPLWDGAGCKGSSTCCSFNNPPWFYKELAESTEAIDMNVCTDEPQESEDLGLQVVEIYVQ